MPIVKGRMKSGKIELQKKLDVPNYLTLETTAGSPGYFWANSSGVLQFGTVEPTTSTYDSAGTSLAAATGADTALSNLASVQIPNAGDLIPVNANQVSVGTAAAYMSDVFFGGSLYHQTATFDSILAFTTPSAADRTYTFPDAGAAADVMLDTGGADVIAYTKGSSTINFAANADLDIATGITVDVDNTTTIQGDLVVSATCTLDQDLQQTANPTFGNLNVTQITDGTATLTAGALSGITTLATTSHVSLGDDNIELRFGATPATDSAIYFDGAGNLMLIDTNLGVARSLTEFYTGTTLNPNVSGNLTIPNGYFHADNIADEEYYFKRNNATGTNPVLEVEETNAAGGVTFLVDSDHTGASDAMQITYDGTAYGLDIVTTAVTSGALYCAGGAGTERMVHFDGVTGHWVGKADEGMVDIDSDGVLIAGANLLRVSSSAANNTASFLVEIEASGNFVGSTDGTCLRIVDAGTAAGTSYAAYIDTTANSGLKVVTGAVGTTNLVCVGPASQTAPIVLIDGSTGPWIGVAGSGMLELTSDGALAATTTNLLRIEHSGDAAAASILGNCFSANDTGAASGESYAGYISSTNNNGLQIVTGATGDINLLLTSSAAGVDNMMDVDGTSGTWVGASTVGMAHFHTDGAIIAGANLVRVTQATGAPEAASYLVEISGAGTWAGTTLGTCLRITDTGAVAGTSYAAYVNSTNNHAMNLITGVVDRSALVCSGLQAQTASMVVLDGSTGSGWEGGATAGMLHLNAIGARTNAASTLLRISDVTGASPASGRGTSLAIADTTTVGADSWVAYLTTTANDGLLIENGHADGKALWLKNSTAGVDCTLHVDGVTGTWVGAQDKGLVLIDSDGTNAHADASLVRIAKTGATVASMNGSCLHIEDASTGGATAGYSVYINSSGSGIEALHIASGKVLIADLVTCSTGIATKCDDTDIVAGSTPTNAEAISAFGAAATVGQGFIGMVDDANAHANEALVMSDGTKYWYITLTACA